MDIRRIVTGLSLVTFVLSLVFLGYTNLLYFLVNCAVLYDCYGMYKQNVSIRLILSIACFMFVFYSYIQRIFHEQFYAIIGIVTIVQLSDVFQYFAGRMFGRTRIGWISKNKTYEGYIIGYALTMNNFLIAHYYGITFMNGDLYQVFPVLTSIYLLGITGGLISSYIKRRSGIKDYSDLLGAHGGWLDRTDSIILPLIFYCH